MQRYRGRASCFIANLDDFRASFSERALDSLPVAYQPLLSSLSETRPNEQSTYDVPNLVQPAYVAVAAVDFGAHFDSL